MKSTPVPKSVRKQIQTSDSLCYIYTSGLILCWNKKHIKLKIEVGTLVLDIDNPDIHSGQFLQKIFLISKFWLSTISLFSHWLNEKLHGF